MATSARRDGDHYVLSGIKTWITSSPIADLAIVWAKVHSFAPRRQSHKTYDLPWSALRPL